MDDFLTTVENKAASMIDGIVAASVGLLAAGGFWLWAHNGESLVISSLITGLPVCF